MTCPVQKPRSAKVRLIERKFAHQFKPGRLDRLYVRGLSNFQKKLLLQAGLQFGADHARSILRRQARRPLGTVVAVLFTLLAVIKACRDLCQPEALIPTGLPS